ncbi:MAG TPA: ABC transporter permease [Acidimicrobiales bacterium]|nr:ABC transporter permease [Acidimicrobiales bacterium]
MRALRAQVAAEITMTLERGESLLVTIGIPAFLLVFFSEVHVLPTGDRDPIDFLAPGVLALAVMSTAMVSLGIATGFERSYGVLKRLGSTPLGRPRLLAAKIASVVAVEAVQVVILVAIAYGLGWRPHASAGLAVLAGLLATVAFAGIGLAMAGALKAEVNLALANAVYLVLLLIGGIVFPVAKLGGFAVVARGLPAAALSRALQASLGGAGASGVPAESWVVLAIWAVAAPSIAAVTFRWE